MFLIYTKIFPFLLLYCTFVYYLNRKRISARHQNIVDISSDGLESSLKTRLKYWSVLVSESTKKFNKFKHQITKQIQKKSVTSIAFSFHIQRSRTLRTQKMDSAITSDLSRERDWNIDRLGDEFNDSIEKVLLSDSQTRATIALVGQWMGVHMKEIGKWNSARSHCGK